MSNDQGDSKGFVVKDRRRFDSDGNERADEQEPIKPTLETTEDIRKSSAAEQLSTDEGAESQQLNFSSFVMSLATQALMQLGEIQPPAGMEVQVDKNGARQTIDILGMLQEKTKNNLDKDEAHLIEQILHNLRLSYVKAVS